MEVEVEVVEEEEEEELEEELEEEGKGVSCGKQQCCLTNTTLYGERTRGTKGNDKRKKQKLTLLFKL